MQARRARVLTIRSGAAIRPQVRIRSYILVYVALAGFLILAHAPLLRLPWFWDEIGQFIPASLDILREGHFVPVSTIPNVHPPGIMTYLALVWKFFGYSIAATRISMLLIAAFGALVSFLLAIELARSAPGTPAFIALAMLCVSPLFFAQSMLAQLDMPAMGLSLLALLLFLQQRIRAAAIASAVLVLVKETGLVIPAVLGAWLLFEGRTARDRARALWFLLPFPGLIVWLVALHHTTGHWFGNPEFTAYNLFKPLRPVAFLLALLRRTYYLFVGSGHILGTFVLVLAWRRVPWLRERPWRIAASLVLAQVILVSALGGAVLERYILPVLPVVYIAFAVALQVLSKRVRWFMVAALLGCLVAANFANPPYPFPFENNLAFVSFVQLEQDAGDAVADLMSSLPGGGRIAAPFPVSNALRDPDFGFVGRPLRTTEIPDFTASSVDRIKADAPDLLVMYKREWDPLHLLDRRPFRDLLMHYYGYRPPLTTAEVADRLSMHVMRQWRRRGLTMQLLARN